MGDDDELLRRWRAGDDDAGNALFERHFDALYRFLANKAGAATEDLVRQTFLACLSGTGSPRGDQGFRTWLYAIARRTLYQHLRSLRRERTFDPSVTSLHDLGTSPTRGLARQEEEALMQQALARLPMELQVAVELSVFEGLPAPAVARVLEVPEDTVEDRVRRAIERLRTELKRLAPTPEVGDRVVAALEAGASAR